MNSEIELTNIDQIKALIEHRQKNPYPKIYTMQEISDLSDIFRQATSIWHIDWEKAGEPDFGFYRIKIGFYVKCRTPSGDIIDYCVVPCNWVERDTGAFNTCDRVRLFLKDNCIDCWYHQGEIDNETRCKSELL